MSVKSIIYVALVTETIKSTVSPTIIILNIQYLTSKIRYHIITKIYEKTAKKFLKCYAKYRKK